MKHSISSCLRFLRKMSFLLRQNLREHYKKQIYKVSFNQQINAIVPSDYNILFLYVMLQISKEYLVDEINMALKGILSKSKLEEKTFYVPPIELQEQFAAFVEQTDKSKVVVQKALDEAQTLFDSLMQEYFG